MAQPGNPYKAQDEAKHLSWDHGYSAMTEEECPYEKDDPDMSHLHHAWQQGFRANKNRPKPKPKAEPVQLVTQEPEAVHAVVPTSRPTRPAAINLTEVPTEALFAEVLRRMSEFESMFSKLKKVLS